MNSPRAKNRSVKEVRLDRVGELHLSVTLAGRQFSRDEPPLGGAHELGPVAVAQMIEQEPLGLEHAGGEDPVTTAAVCASAGGFPHAVGKRSRVAMMMRSIFSIPLCKDSDRAGPFIPAGLGTRKTAVGFPCLTNADGMAIDLNQPPTSHAPAITRSLLWDNPRTMTPP